MSQAEGKSPRILIVAEHASAKFGGEALIPFQYFKHLRRMGIEVHLLVHQRTRDELRSSFPHDLDRLHFVADSLVNVWCHKIGSLMPDRLGVFTVGVISHLDTQVRQRRRVRSLLRSQNFDIIHEPIPVSPKVPSSMFGFSVPVIVGPMNGGMDYPPHYDLAGRMERLIVRALRASASFWNRIVPGKRHAALLLVADSRTWNALPANLRNKKILEFVENGVDLDLFEPVTATAKSKKFRIIYVGRFVDWKRVDLLLDACARLLGHVAFQVDLVGDGPLRAALQEQVRRLSLTNHVRFHGRLPQSGVAERMSAADVMVLPSMHECGGAVVLEAMASGLPVVAAKWGGPTDYVAADTGVLIPPATPEIFVSELAAAMLAMAKDSEARAEMGRAGRRRVAAIYDWRVKAKALLQIYKDVLDSHPAQMKVQAE